LIAGAPPGHDAELIASLAAGRGGGVLFIARNDVRMDFMREALEFFAPHLDTPQFPAWDCLPYDRVSSNLEIASRRIDTLSRLLESRESGETGKGRVILTTVSAVLQRVPPEEELAGATFALALGDRLDPEKLIAFLVTHGYLRAETVMEPGEYAVRGGIVDVFPAGRAEPLRLDFFGDELDALRSFDPATQRTTDKLASFTIKPVSEVLLHDAAVARFRTEYRSLFGAVGADDPLYAGVSSGRRQAGMEHWLPLFHPRMSTVFDYAPGAAVVLDHHLDDARDARLDLIREYFDARSNIDTGRFAELGTPYNPLPPDRLYLSGEEWDGLLAERAVGQLSPFAVPEDMAGGFDAGGRPGPDFAEARLRGDVNVFDLLTDRLVEHRKRGRRAMVAAVTRGSRDRLKAVMAEHGLTTVTPVDGWAEATKLKPDTLALAVLGLDRGFVTSDWAVIAEQDILGDRLSRSRARRVRAENFLTETSSLNPGDLVVHMDHGIGRYEGLETISVSGAPHDCLRILYAGDSKLFLPVENIEVISRFGSDSAGVPLDRLGGAAWQARKAKLKSRIRDMADELIKVAASRTLRPAPVLTPAEGLFDEFCARFPYAETDDQLRAIDDVIGDLAGGHPADRLVCGDVGFGKTEVALRAAFVTAMEGRQVAVVVPTTLLCRQHYRTFVERFKGYPVRIGELSRLVVSKQAKATKAELADGTLDIVIGTHALVAKDVKFRDLGLLVVDEEQHFGVAHKEKLKKLKTNVHVLTLTATPIPRTLQMALTGVRELSLIATPPIDRLAVRTYVLELDPVVIREAILREQYRGGQTFYVCPRIEDLDDVKKLLAELVPEAKVVMAHGRMGARDLEGAVGVFYEGAYDVLLSTNIIESGLDLPSVNTIVLHRADMFGLAQLYQLRGRVGRAKIRAYAYLTLPPRRKVTPAALKRLEVMQSLDALGAGFSLASHDLDIRGAGNLLGEEQSGQIREVGIELYQQMLEEAVAEARGGVGEGAGEDEWSPQISIGLGVLIPEPYVPDLGLRLGLYRRLADFKEAGDIEAFAAELVDRFGELPDEVNNLLQVVAIKQLCRKAGIEKVEAGPKGAVVTFRDNAVANPAGLVQFITRQASTAKLRPDHKLVLKRGWETPGDRLVGVRKLARDLAELAGG
jgi:transcription-repair coupling factor (superfamily II helicase)